MTARILKLTLIVALLGVIFSRPLSAANTIDVERRAALNGTNFGLAVRFDGVSNRSTYVMDETPDAESTYGFRVRLKRKNVDVPLGKRVDFLKAKGAGNVLLLRAGIFRNAVGNYKGWVGVRLANGRLREFRFHLNKSDTLLEVLWSSASAPGGHDGTIVVSVNGVEKLNVSNLTRVDAVESVQLGALRGTTRLDNIAGGKYFLDEFESFRTLAP